MNKIVIKGNWAFSFIFLPALGAFFLIFLSVCLSMYLYNIGDKTFWIYCVPSMSVASLFILKEEISTRNKPELKNIIIYPDTIELNYTKYYKKRRKKDIFKKSDIVSFHLVVFYEKIKDTSKIEYAPKIFIHLKNNKDILYIPTPILSTKRNDKFTFHRQLIKYHYEIPNFEYSYMTEKEFLMGD